tara:strand:+ start:19307 stop:19645 length:339 start_codon:yes stop_codon:yes gene_type:complete
MISLVGLTLFWPIKIHSRNSGQTLLKSAIADPASIALGSLVLAGAALVMMAPLWPSLELHRSGLIVFAMGCGFSFLFAFAAVYDDIQDRKAEKRSDRTMHKRLQKMRKNQHA